MSDTLSLKHDPSHLQLRHLTTDTTPLCPISLLTLSPHETLLFVHPSAFPTVLAFLSSLSIPFEERPLNQYLIISQLVGLQHLYNVCAPLVADEESRITMEAIKDMKFDSSQINPQQVIVLNLKREMLDEQFKMERYQQISVPIHQVTLFARSDVRGVVKGSLLARSHLQSIFSQHRSKLVGNN